MKKITLSLFAAALSCASLYSQVNVVIDAPAYSAANGSTQNRAPNGNPAHTRMRAMYTIPASELTSINGSIVSFGFELDAGLNVAASGNFTVYMQNTPSSTYAMGTTWTTAGMTQVFQGVYNIPATVNPAAVDMTFASSFPYTAGQAINVCYEYEGISYDPQYGAVYAALNTPGVNMGATGASATMAAPTLALTDYRPVMRLGTPNSVTNDIQVIRLTAPGKLPKNHSDVIEAEIRNISNTAINNIAVGLAVTGANSFASPQVVPTLAAGASATVSFNFVPSTQGAQTLSVGVMPDQNNANNTFTATQNITCEIQTNNPLLANSAYLNGVGFNSGTGYFVKRFTTAAAQTVKAMNIAIGTESVNIGKQIYGVLVNASGGILATTNTITISNTTAGTFQRFDFPTVQSVAAGDFYLGTAQTTASTFPIGMANPTFPSDRMYSLIGGTLNQYSANSGVGYFGMEAIYTSSVPVVGATSSRSVMCKGETAILTGGGATTYTWSNPAGSTTSTISVSPTVTTVYTISATDANGCTNKGMFTQTVVACTGLMVNAVNGADIKLYPNPAISGKSTLSGLNGMNKIVVYNILGQSVSSVISNEESITIDLANQPNGTYLIKITDEANNSKTVKIVNQN